MSSDLHVCEVREETMRCYYLILHDKLSKAQNNLFILCKRGIEGDIIMVCNCQNREKGS